MPDDYQEFGRKWQSLNPDWIVKDWTEDTLPPLINQGVWDDLGQPLPGQTLDEIAVATQRADVVDYELVYRYGGLYVNTDIEPVRPLDQMFWDYPDLYRKPGAVMEDDQWMVNAVMWAPGRKNDFYWSVINNLPRRYFENYGGYMNGTTGPHLLTSVWQMGYDVVQLPVNTFNFVHFRDVPSGGVATFDEATLPPEVIGIHHWGHRRNGRHQTKSY